MRGATIVRPTPIAAVLALALACSNGAPEETGLAEQPIPYDSITAAEMEKFALDPRRFPEMEGTAPLDSIDMTARSSAGDAAWHVQYLNYTSNHIAMTYAAWYTGPDSLVQFAADGQPHLVDDEGNRYEGVLTPTNPRIKIETDNTAVGVLAFGPGLSPEADSLTLYVNDLTEPVIRVGPWPVREDAARAPQPGAPR
jgi:hypothetical protein